MKLHREFPDERIAVLNFASALTPGGVRKGASAQEEVLCRCSTLYEVLNQKFLWEKYCSANRAMRDNRYTDAVIFSPNIIICKTDESIPKRMKQEDFVSVDVITCAAPRLPETYDSSAEDRRNEELYRIYCRRISHILYTAALNQADILVLGAFGCGAFHNDPSLVSKGFCTAMDAYPDRFHLLEYAIYCRKYETENYRVFRRNLERFL